MVFRLAIWGMDWKHFYDFFIVTRRWNALFTRDPLALSLFLFSSFLIFRSPFDVGPRGGSGSCRLG